MDIFGDQLELASGVNHIQLASNQDLTPKFPVQHRMRARSYTLSNIIDDIELYLSEYAENISAEGRLNMIAAANEINVLFGFESFSLGRHELEVPALLVFASSIAECVQSNVMVLEPRAHRTDSLRVGTYSPSELIKFVDSMV
jgi:hypothetical protein